MIVHLMLASELDDNLEFVLRTIALIDLAKSSFGKAILNGVLSHLNVLQFLQQILCIVFFHCLFIFGLDLLIVHFLLFSL